MSKFIRIIAVAITLLGFGLAGVSAQDDPPSKFADLGLPELKFTVTDDGLDAPAEAEAGLTLVTLDNQSMFDESVNFLKAPDGMTLDDLIAAGDASSETGEIPDWFYSIAFAGGAVAKPSVVGHAVVDLASGDWIVYENQDFESAHQLKVSGDGDRAESGDVPSDEKVTFEDGKFNFPDELESGSQVWEITNEDDVPFIAGAYYYPGEMTVEDLKNMFTGNVPTDADSPPIDFAKLVSGPSIPIVSKDQIAWVEQDLKPGSYVMISWSFDQDVDFSNIENAEFAEFTVPGDIPTS